MASGRLVVLPTEVTKVVAGAAARARGAAARKRLKAPAAVAEDFVVKRVEAEVGRLWSFRGAAHGRCPLTMRKVLPKTLDKIGVIRRISIRER